MPNTTVKLDPAQWAYIKALQPSTPRFVFHSCRARMVPKDPTWPEGPQVPWIEKPGRSARYAPGERAYMKWRKTRSNLKWIQHLMEMPSEYSE